MLLGGLWHGAAYTFIVWGAHPRRVPGGRARARPASAPTGRGARRAVRVAWFVVVQAAVLVAWIFFRSESMAGARDLRRQPRRRASWRWPPTWMVASLVFLAPLVAHARLDLAGGARAASARSAPAAKAALAAGMTYAIATMYAGTSDFIYFQF